jgi:hypothetical protein
VHGALTRFAPLALLTLGAGCVHVQAMEELAPEPETTESNSPPGVVRDIEVTYDDDDDEEEETDEGSPSPPAPPVAPRPDRPPPDPVLFSLGAGHGALGRVDLRPCKEEGLQPGYLHMRVTFRHSGRIVRAALESPIEPPSEALACISEQLEVAMVPVFDGDDVTLSRTFFVN